LRVTFGDLVDDVEGEVVDQSPVERGRALNAHEPVIFEAADVVGEVLGIALGRECHVPARADLFERGARHLMVGIGVVSGHSSILRTCSNIA
jgi:hypothetical protein